MTTISKVERAQVIARERRVLNDLHERALADSWVQGMQLVIMRLEDMLDALDVEADRFL